MTTVSNLDMFVFNRSHCDTYMYDNINVMITQCTFCKKITTSCFLCRQCNKNFDCTTGILGDIENTNIMRIELDYSNDQNRILIFGFIGGYDKSDFTLNHLTGYYELSNLPNVEKNFPYKIVSMRINDITYNKLQ